MNSEKLIWIYTQLKAPFHVENDNIIVDDGVNIKREDFNKYSKLWNVEVKRRDILKETRLDTSDIDSCILRRKVEDEFYNGVDKYLYVLPLTNLESTIQIPIIDRSGEDIRTVSINMTVREAKTLILKTLARRHASQIAGIKFKRVVKDATTLAELESVDIHTMYDEVYSEVYEAFVI